MLLVDDAGNQTGFTFEIIFVLMQRILALFAGLVALAVLGTSF